MSKAIRLADFLCRRGFGILGSGMYSIVMAHGESDRCVKICRGSDVVRPHADRWCEYIMWAHRMGYAGTFAPKLYSLHCFEDGMYAAVIERLWKTLGLYRGKERAEYYDISEGIRPENVRTYPGLRGDFYRALRKEFPGTLDLHNDNWMIRHNGDLVLTDPLYNRGTIYSMRLREHDLGNNALLAHIAQIAQIGAAA